MKQYLMVDENKTYQANDDDGFLELVKNGNSHTKELSLEAYIHQTSQTINSLTEQRVETPCSSEIVDAWEKMGVIQRIDTN